MEESAKIIAINTDRDAPIFSVAHYGIVGDLNRCHPDDDQGDPRWGQGRGPGGSRSQTAGYAPRLEIRRLKVGRWRTSSSTTTTSSSSSTTSTCGASRRSARTTSASARSHDYAPLDAADAVDNYRRILRSLGEVAADVIAPTAEQIDREGNTLNDDGTVTLRPGHRRGHRAPGPGRPDGLHPARTATAG